MSVSINPRRYCKHSWSSTECTSNSAFYFIPQRATFRNIQHKKQVAFIHQISAVPLLLWKDCFQFRMDCKLLILRGTTPPHQPPMTFLEARYFSIMESFCWCRRHAVVTQQNLSALTRLSLAQDDCHMEALPGF